MNAKPKIVAIVGMEQFNHGVWNTVRKDLADYAEVSRYTDMELDRQDAVLGQELRDADCVFLSMLHTHDGYEFLKTQLAQSKAQTVFAYESMPDVMAFNKVGDYVIANSGKKAGMPAPVKKIAMMLVKGREEDALYGYTKLMKAMQAMMRFMPAKMRDFKNWMTVNIYWNQPQPQNITSMFKLILREYFGQKIDVPAAVEMPMMGCYHPDAPGFFKDAKGFDGWKKTEDGRRKTENARLAKVNGLALANGSNGRSSVLRPSSSRVALLFFRKHLAQERSYIDDTIRAMEAAGLDVLPIFVTGVEAHVVVRDWLAKEHVDAIVSMIGFALVGGPAGSTKPGLSKHVAEEILGHLNIPYIVAQPLFLQDYQSWRELGASPMQSATLYALPEMDGAVSPVVVAALKDGKFQSSPQMLNRLITQVQKWTALKHVPNKDKRVAIVVYDYPPGMGKKATAALLDVPRSLLNILQRLQREGYSVGNLPETPAEMMAWIEEATDQNRNPQGLSVSVEAFRNLTTPSERERMEQRWGTFPGEIAPMSGNRVFIGGLCLGNIYIGVQPRMGVQGDPMRLLFDKENAPHHQYLSFYRWISREFGAHAVIHSGMHGSAEWMPGKQLGLTHECWADVINGELPNLYLYPMNNPSEANIAKRRGYAAMVSHNVPPMMRAGLYKELMALKEMLTDWRERDGGRKTEDGSTEAILRKVELANLDTDLPRLEGESFVDYASRLYTYLRELEDRLINGSLHVFGEASPIESQKTVVTEALKARGNGHSLGSVLMTEDGGRKTEAGRWHSYTELAAAARKGDGAAVTWKESIDQRCIEFVDVNVFGNATHKPSSAPRLSSLDELATYGRQLAHALSDNQSEMDGLLRGLSGGFILPHPGGDLIRDGLSVLPTGRNIHAIDPWRIPSDLAYTRGSQIADAILQKHVAETGAYPETIAEVLWGLDTIKTKGESVGTVLRLIGARPAYDSQGKISQYELIPLSELNRPRIDVLMNLSPIFRDTFEITMDFLDKLVRAAAKADEPNEMNYIKKHVEESMGTGLTFEQATARLFTQQPGQYGTYVDDMIDDSAWDKSDDLDATFVRRNGYAYGGGRHGQAAGPILQKLLGTVGRVVQEIDSVEFGVTDIDHYFSSSGALQLAARKRSSANVKLSYVETFTAETKIDDLDKVLRVEYRTKLLNPKWFEGMLQHGHSGAAEISNRFTYMLGWDAVSDSVDDWVYSDAANTFALDPNMRERLTQANPQAMRNIVGRLLEANGRGLWQANDQTIDQLRELYADLEDRLEGVQVA